jgi:predicted flap endonuclease-1-like 5' DNA nuclease
MGLFIIGVLAGWVAEWLFFTFFMKGKTDSSGGANTSALQAELDSKNKEIKVLQAKIADSGATGSPKASSTATSTTASSAIKTATATASKTKTATQTAAKKATSAAKAKPSASKPAVKKAAVSKKTSTTAKTSTPKAATKKATSTQSKKASKKPEKKTSTKATTSKKAPATKAKTAPKKTTAKAKTKTKTAKATTAKKTTGDDFTKLSGIGPSMAATLNELGIDTYRKLADMDDDILRDMLEASGARLNNNKEAMDSWNEQALLAEKGDFEGLKKLQAELKK